ncbi:pancreatic triacylglycerol lipase-like protein [Leptotrombidium deliense]|uniref:Pancreatic triacylglycerol lipase-like protein n=1 Tax=Leptotrombidium deliense TaxID=299467 RepID=A0A443S219_9ACAR|nr:pancreatic triacylglycerol lipase-like protein [Leptotrombidium deliense]
MISNILAIYIFILTKSISADTPGVCSGKIFSDIGYVAAVHPYKCGSPNCVHAKEFECKYYIYDFHNRNNGVIVDNKFENLKNINLTRNVWNVFITHGWLSGIEKNAYFKEAKDLYFKKLKNEVNVILVDWSEGAVINYKQAVANTRVIGKRIALLIEKLIPYGLQLNNTVLNGHSLGAHVMGLAGRTIFKKLGHKVSQINGEDPARPCFNDSGYHINASDATLVQIFHTDAGCCGTDKLSGHHDFYPNSGIKLPACITTIQNHGKILKFLSVDHQEFGECQPIAYRCDNYQSFIKGRCTECGEGSDCKLFGYGHQIGDTLLFPRISRKYFINEMLL